MVAASVVAAACGDVLSLATGRQRSDLVLLLMQSNAPQPPSASMYAVNSRVATRTISHPDAANTPFAQVSFPAGSITTLNGTRAATTDSVLIGLAPETGAYGLAISLSGATLSSTNPPTVTFFYGRYADFTASRAGSRYAGTSELASALEVWAEDQLGYRVASGTASAGTASAGTDAIRASVTSSGHYLVAAHPK
ncbi:MAG: hypothetical protein EXR93_04745 [Gemmatimonadetes bacterium]|nr:hypothetical protein [Gemmatimonadota bacterium]